MPESNSKPSKTTIPNLMDVTIIPSLKFPMALPLAALTCQQKFRKTCSAAERGLASPFSPWAS